MVAKYWLDAEEKEEKYYPLNCQGHMLTWPFFPMNKKPDLCKWFIPLGFAL
jgi:hypothetical protein